MNSNARSDPSMDEILASIRQIIAEDSDVDHPADRPDAAPSEPEADEVLELTEMVERDGRVVSLAATPARAEDIPAEAETESAADEELKVSSSTAEEPSRPDSPLPDQREAPAKPIILGGAKNVTVERNAPLPEAAAAPVGQTGDRKKVGATAPAEREDRSMTMRIDDLVSQTTAAASKQSIARLAEAVARQKEAARRTEAGLQDAGHAPDHGSSTKSVEDLVRDALRPLLKEWIDANLPPLVERVVREEIEKLVRKMT